MVDDCKEAEGKRDENGDSPKVALCTLQSFGSSLPKGGVGNAEAEQVRSEGQIMRDGSK